MQKKCLRVYPDYLYGIFLNQESVSFSFPSSCFCAAFCTFDHMYKNSLRHERWEDEGRWVGLYILVWINTVEHKCSMIVVKVRGQ